MGLNDFRVTILLPTEPTFTEVATQTITAGETASFVLPAGTYTILVVAFRPPDQFLGYFLRRVELANTTVTTIPGIRITNTPPTLGPEVFNEPPFLLFTEVPGTATGATPFSVEASVYNNDGSPAQRIFNDISLTSSDIGLSLPVAPRSSNAQGVVRFNNVEFPVNSNGTTRLTVDGPGLDPATTGDLQVTAAVPFAQTLEKLSSAFGGGESDAGSFSTASFSADGRFVAFESASTNILPQGTDTNGVKDTFVVDRENGTIERVSVSTAGVESDGETLGGSRISADGRMVAFRSVATNLLGPGVDTNGQADIFVYDRQTDTLELASVGDDGKQSPTNSAGRFDLSANGRFVSFSTSDPSFVANDNNGRTDTFVRDLAANTTELVSLANDGSQGNLNSGAESAISADGRFVAFTSLADNLLGPGNDTNGVRDAFVRDRLNNTLERVSISTAGVQSDDSVNRLSISDDGRFVAMSGSATTLVADDTNGEEDVFVRDRTGASTERVSTTAPGGVEGNGRSRLDSNYADCVSADGRFVVFASRATNLVPGDTNGVEDIFVFDRTLRRIERVSVTNTGGEANDRSDLPTNS